MKKRRLELLGVAIALGALLVAFFWKMLFLPLAIGGLDVLDYFYPYRTYAAQAIQHGRLPLWNPDIFGGVPFLANIQASVFYPLSALFYLLPAPSAYTWSIVVHVFLGALFAYLFARSSLELSALPALLSAVIFGFGGFMGGQLGHLNQFSAAIWLPALLLCWDRGCARRPLFVLLGSAVFTLLLLAGHTQVAYLAVVALLAYAAYRTLISWRWQGPGVLPVNIIVTAVVLGLGGLMASAQILPTTELTSWSIRSGGLSYDLVTSSSLKASMLFQALFPPYWNRALLLEPGTSEFMGYVGVLPLVLTLAALIYGRRRHTGFFALLALVSLFLALGKQNPLFPVLYRTVPGFNLFRVPARWLFLYSFGIAMLCGLGADALLCETRRLNWRPMALLAGLGTIVGLIAARAQSLPPPSTVATWAGFGALALVLVFCAMGADRRVRPTLRIGQAIGPSETTREWRRPLWGSAFLLTTSIELWLGGQSLDYSQPVPASVFGQAIPTVQFLQQQTGDFRSVSVANDTFVPSIEPSFRQAHQSDLDQEQTLSYLAYYKLREILEPNTSMAENLATIDGYDGGLLPLARYVGFKDALAGRPSSPDDRLRFVVKWLPTRPLLDLAGVRYAVFDRLSDKAAAGVEYDLSSFIRVDPGRPQAILPLDEPTETTSIGFVVALKGDPLPPDGTLATLILTSVDGSTETVPIKETDLQPFSVLPYADKLATRVGTLLLPHPLDVQSVGVTLKALGDEFYLNGLALIDDRIGRYVSPLVAPGGGFRRVYSGDVKVYENEHALPSAFLVHDARLVESGQDALDALRSPDFDPGAWAAIEPNPAPPTAHSIVGRIIAKISRQLLNRNQFSPPQDWFQAQAPQPDSPADAVTSLASSPEDLVVQTASSRAGFLVRTQSYFPGWQVTVDGKPDHLLAADYLFQAVHLPAGVHRVEFSYRPASLLLGTGISILALLAWIAALVCTMTIWRRPRTESSAPSPQHSVLGVTPAG